MLAKGKAYKENIVNSVNMKSTFNSLVHGFIRYGKFSSKEILDMALISFAFGFIFSFRLWGDETTFSLAIGLYNLILFSLFSLFAILAMQFGIRFMAVDLGYTSKLEIWKLGMGFNLFICFLTNGLSIFLTPPGFELKRNLSMEVGKYNKGLVRVERAYLVFWGFFTLVLYTVLIKLIFPMKLAEEMTKVAYVIAIWTLFPLDFALKFFYKDAPISNGTTLLYGVKCYRAFSIFTITFLVMSAILSFTLDGISALCIGLAISLIVFWASRIFYDELIG